MQVSIILWALKLWSYAFCFFGRHNFKAIDVEWNYVIMKCASCNKTNVNLLPME